MTAEQWHQVKQIVADALEIPLAQRTEFVEDASTEYEVRGEALSLLASYDEAETEARLNTAMLASFPAAAQKAAPTGQRVGAYELVRLISRGGMGAVYLAERADGQFAQRVALKFIDRVFPAPELVRRFVSERNILARLQHPGIARLLDGGMTETAGGERLPYLVMEYVEGEPITDYCTRTLLPLEGRLRLFIDMCEAVAYAHRNLIVHRDLKPGNVYVVERDGRPRVKLLDFGIAKLLEESDDEALTRTGAPMLTPDFAAPEQFSGAPVTTAADVYALGVLLFELLTGRRPYTLARMSAAEMERIICETEPPRPSTAVETRGEETGRLQRRLRGDLDQIVLKALRKEPERRYASAEAMADDLKRHLDGLPVRARPDTLRYRAAKFTRRHRFGVGAAVLVLVVLLGGIVATANQSRRAQAEAAKAAEINDFLLTMLAAPDPEAEGREVTVAQLLDAAVERADQGLHAHPAVEASIRQTLGRTYVGLGLFDEGEEQLQKALRVQERLFGPRHLDVAETQAVLADAWRKQGRYEEADTLYRQALATTRRHFGENSVKTSARMSDVGVNLWQMGDYDGAEPLLRQSLELEEHLRDPDHEEVAISLGNLATLLADTGREAEAEPLYQRQLEIMMRRHGLNHPKVALALTLLGVLRHDLGFTAEADSLHTLALSVYRRTSGDAHPDVAYALNNLAATRMDLGRLDEAERLQQEALSILRASVGEEHPSIGIQLNNLGATYSRRGDLESAVAAYAEAVAVWRTSLPPQHPYIAHGLYNVGSIRLKQQRAAEAEAPLREALAIREASLPPGHEAVLTTESLLGACIGKLGRRAEAERRLVHAYETLRDRLGADHASTLEAAGRLADFYTTTGRAADASRLMVAAPGPAAR